MMLMGALVFTGEHQRDIHYAENRSKPGSGTVNRLVRARTRRLRLREVVALRGGGAACAGRRGLRGAARAARGGAGCAGRRGLAGGVGADEIGDHRA
jgi:hypothetical protein